MTLIEMMVGMMIGSLVLTMVGLLWYFGSRSFVAMSNYVDLDGKSRSAVDLISADVRGASQVIDFGNSASNKWIQLTNADFGITVKYRWDSSARTLVCEKTGQDPQVYLTECDRWDCNLYQRTPQTNANYTFYPATNLSGAIDLTICKLVDMDWKCSRSILANDKVNTESVQSTQIVLRNKQ